MHTGHCTECPDCAPRYRAIVEAWTMAGAGDFDALDRELAPGDAEHDRLVAPVHYFVVLPWGQYHRLDQWARAHIYASAAEAEAAREDHLDQVVICGSLEAANEVAEAFARLSMAAWTPNQGRDEYDHNGEVIAAAEAVLDRYR